MRWRWTIAMLALLMGACSAPKPLPEPQYFRLAPSTVVVEKRAPLTSQTIWVERFTAADLYMERALVYSTRPDGLRSRQYHYQYWADPPVRMLDRRLASLLRRSGIAADVTRIVPRGVSRLRVSGYVARFDRVRQSDDSWAVVIELELAVEDSDARRMLWQGHYEDRELVNGDRMEDSVQAYSVALDRIYAQFLADLSAQLEARPSS